MPIAPSVTSRSPAWVRLAVVAVDNHGGRARAIHRDITGIGGMGVVAVNARTDGAARDSLITFVDNERVVAIDIQRRGVRAADGSAPGVIDHHVIAGNVGRPVPPSVMVHITVIVDAGVIAVNDGAGGSLRR
ncbi:Uncharacterised protein [Salmonella enterica subsp. enterica]|uniref:Uncharacterized protein n=1 Tax=Salmonella enterica I TaxID=59201 RepID=A0A3S4K5U0_SALET|nr:Uncharacterised protein [Salmonella enterica subsp. enterica]